MNLIKEKWEIILERCIEDDVNDWNNLKKLHDKLGTDDEMSEKSEDESILRYLKYESETADELIIGTNALLGMTITGQIPRYERYFEEELFKEFGKKYTVKIKNLNK